MGARLYTRHGGLAGATFQLLTDTQPSFDHNTPLIELGNSCQNGSASQGTFTIEDPTSNWLTGEAGSLYIPSRTLVRWTEDASGNEIWLAQGRVASEEVGRGTMKAGDYVQHTVTVDDCNVDLRGLAFTETWGRPAETDTERLYALQAYILNGASSTSPTFRPSTTITVDDTHLAPDTNTVTMLAKDYLPGTQPAEIVNECVSQAGKYYGVVIHHTGGSHLCLFYSLENDHGTYLSNIIISDDPTRVDPSNDIYAPIWDQGHGTVASGQACISGLVSYYDAESFVYVNLPFVEAQQEVWIDMFSDSDAQGDLTSATARATAIVDYRRLGDFTYRLSILMAADQTQKIAAGMSVKVDTAVVIGGPLLGFDNELRIAVLTWQPAADDLYWAHMQLGRGYRNLPPSQGKLLRAIEPGGAPVG